MHVRVNRDGLMAVLGRVGGVVEKRQTLPILGNILLTAGEGCLEVAGTDLEVEIRTKMEAEVDDKGEMTVPARKIVEIIRALPEGIEVSFTVEKERVSVVAGRSRFALSTLPASDFPMMEVKEELVGFEVEQGNLRRLLDKTCFAMAQQDVRYYLNGLLLEVMPNRLVLVATDGHRLAKVEEEVGLEVEEEVQVIVPRKTVMELRKLLEAEKNEKAKIAITGRNLRAVLGKTVLTSKLVDGRYPDYRRVIPQNLERVAYADRELFRHALLRTAILSNEKYRGVELRWGKGLLRLQAHNPEQEEAEEELEIQYAEDEVVMGFNAGYLVDVLNVLEEALVEVYFTDSYTSAVLGDKGKEKETYVVMPLRL